MTSSFRDHGARKPPSASPGTDLGVASGTEVLAVADAVVTGRGNAPGTSGRWVQLVAFLPGYGYLTVTYRHLAAYLVRPGQEVRRGDLIAKSGAPHLHIDGQHLGRYVDLAPMMGV